MSPEHRRRGGRPAAATKFRARQARRNCVAIANRRRNHGRGWAASMRQAMPLSCTPSRADEQQRPGRVAQGWATKRARQPLATAHGVAWQRASSGCVVQRCAPPCALAVERRSPPVRDHARDVEGRRRTRRRPSAVSEFRISDLKFKNCGSLRQSGPRPDPRLLRQAALKALMRSARTDSPHRNGRKQFSGDDQRRRTAVAAAAA
ncbi:LysM domain GPI-anchored protein 1 precursor [Dorcoceras hygrometricum]|uniref:LysM domain GPI-anchored protein 1 n=1 Tax=Dorcoceras hygrometricum TaxID=472368 RepID=A0A2Z7C009_9LAMI|nr:LysM domain GPI-anchored protein 1 precursor [Dorcoceras hygrometricum]